MKTILLLLDGIGDRSYKRLDHQTPLQAAATPNLDRLAALGSNGLYHAAHCGQCLPSDIAHFLMFGYERRHIPGRGLLEAVGEGVNFADADVLCLAHLAGVAEKEGVFLLTHGRDDLMGSAEEMGRFFDAVANYKSGEVTIRLVHTRRNAAILVLSGPVCPFISDSDPITKSRPIAAVCPLAGNPEPAAAARTAGALNDYLSHCHRELSRPGLKTQKRLAPVNFLVTRSCGRRRPQVPFERKWGFKGLLAASLPVLGGLAREVGMDYAAVSDTGDPGSDLQERLRAALSDTGHDFIHVHTKMADEAAHTGDPEFKKDVIESLDEGLAELVRAVEDGGDLLAVITAGHSSPSSSALIHSGEPLPLTMAGPNVRRDNVRSYNEIDTAAGCLGFLRGDELMHMIVNCIDRAVLTGHRLGPRETVFYPSDYPNFQSKQKDS
jgi:2,3-bisphosphoglycerate-independent phosphoglycerate mutase